MRPGLRAWSFPVAIALAACSSPATDASESTSQSIVHGTASTSAQDAVVLIYDVKLSFECTGVLIAPNLVLTARHCVSSLNGDALECDKNGNAVSGGTLGADNDPTELAVYVGSTRARTFPTATARGTKIVHDDATNICNHDLAVLEIAPAITTVTPASLRLDAGPSTQDTVTVVGWGVTDTQTIASARMQRTGVKVTAVGPSDANGVPVPPNNFLLGESICDGDSGAPAFADISGAVIGIASSGTNGAMPDPSNPVAACVDDGRGVINTFTSIAPFKSVLDKAFADVGGQPTVDDKAPVVARASSGGCAAAHARSPADSPIAALAIFGALAAIAARFPRRRERD